MSIEPASDIVLDVARAADPARLQAGAARLGTTPESGTFEAVLASPEAIRSASGNGLNGVAGLGGLGERMQSVMPATARSSPARAYQGLEAFLLQTMIGSMLPQNAESSFGKGTAGSIWKSMMAEHLANSIAKAGGIGVARMLDAASAATRKAGAG